MQRRDCTAFVNCTHDVPESERRNRYTSAQNMSQENFYIYLQVDSPSMIGNNAEYFEQLPSRYICKRNVGFMPTNIIFYQMVIQIILEYICPMLYLIVGKFIYYLTHIILYNLQ